jgi:DNA-binding LacI/PurR family transcriptional regulator
MRLRNLEAQYRYHIKNRSHCPVVSVRREIEEYYNVLVDDNTVLNEVISHFIHIHGFTRINFLAGPKGLPDSERRLEAYRKILKENNLPVEENRIYYGDFWKQSGYAAVEHWFSGTGEMPQAIVCANDYMAFTVCKALAERGIEVPDQVAVTGCDDINDASEFRPSLTTVKVPIYDMEPDSVTVNVGG